MSNRVRLASLNSMDQQAFVACLGEVFEHSPWVAAATWTERPFASTAELHAAMVVVMQHADPLRQLVLLRAHPELARASALTTASAEEQAAIGFGRLQQDEAAAFASANAAYRDRFGFPFVIAVRGQRDRAAILAALRSRLAADPETERHAALTEVARIARFRLDDLVDDG
jgi:OHCU decarboxylase